MKNHFVNRAAAFIITLAVLWTTGCASGGQSSVVSDTSDTSFDSGFSSVESSSVSLVSSIASSAASDTTVSSIPSSSTASIVSSKASSAVSKVSSTASSTVTSQKASSQTVSSKPAASSTSSVSKQSALSVSSTSSIPIVKNNSDELRGMWISYVELAGITDYNVYKTRINHMFDSAVNLGLNTILFQVRPYGDALYPSKIFPWSHIIGYKTSAGKPIQGVDPGYDPLGYAVAAAHARGLKLQAWVNPYRIFISGGTVADLAPNNPAKIWLTDNNPANDTWVRTINGIMYYNPAVPQVQQLIIDGIKEIVQNYAVDGVHFDDYFYPTTATTFDDTEYNAYKLCGGSLSLGDWRRKNVNDLVSGVYTAVHSIRDIPFGISPQARIAYVHDSCYADLPLWATTPGYVDYLCPEIYFGFQNQTYPFLSTLSAWDCMMTNPAIKLYIGLPAYKLGNVDNNAGTGKYEFQTSTEILKRMVQAVRMSNAAGFVLYSYSATVDPKNTAEITALKAIMNN